MEMSKAKQLRLKSLQDELKKLEKDYKAVDEKKLRESNPQERNNLALQREAIANQMEEIEQQLDELEKENGDVLIRRPSHLKEGDWEMLFEHFLPYDFADIQRAFLRGIRQAFGHDFQQVRPDHPPLNEPAQIQKLLAAYDNPELAVRFVEFVIVELQRSSEGNNRDLTALKQWRDRIAQNHNISLEEPKPITSINRQAYLLIALKESGRQTQKDGSFVKVFAELRVTGEATPIEFEAAAVTCSLNEVAEHLSKLIRKAEEALIPYECDKVTLELFLPCIHLEEDVADWQVRNEQNRPRRLGKHRRFLVRSLDRAEKPKMQRTLERKWQLLKNCVEAKTVCEQFHLQEDCPDLGDLEALLDEKPGLRLLAELPDDREQRLDILYDIINSGVPIALWSSKFDSCTATELKTQFNNLLEESELTNFANLAQKWRMKRTEVENVAIKNIRLLCDCPERWPSLPDPEQEEDLLVAF
jgi:hypothetical protein